MDVVLSALALVLAGPLMLLVALWVRLSSPGPILYRAQRAGLGGKPFEMLKFRTMKTRADHGGAITTADDSRVLPLGKIIRVLRLDELPQIFNVLRGEMSLVGPRPEDVEIVRQCYTPEQRAVLDVLPGLAGVPQVAFLFDTSDLDPGGMDPQQHYREIILPLRLTLDLMYIQRRTLWYDLYLLGKTLVCIAIEPWSLLVRHPRQRWARLERYDAVTR